MNKKVSTDAKLASIIHSKNDDQEVEDALRQQEKLAKLRLRRACLYGGGARTRVPKIKKAKKSNWSPFQLGGGMKDEPPAIAINNSGSPGAHEDMFRMVTNSTRAAHEDPDRICFNSTRMKEGLRVLPQPPWYLGYQNQPAPSDTSLITAASRYGYRGSKNILQYETKAYANPAATRTEYTPKFLTADTGYVDEYVPPVLLTKAGTINNMEAPRLWPENAEYVTGFAGKRMPTMWRYKRETTVDLPTRPQSPPQLREMLERSNSERDTLRDYARMEAAHTTQSAPQLAQLRFETTWRDTLVAEGTATLRRTLRGTQTAPYVPQTLLDPSDAMRYSGTSAMIIHSQSTDELKLRLRMERTKEKVNAPYHARWTHVAQHLDNISRKLKRHQHLDQALLRIAELFQQVARHGGSETAMRRAEFVAACGRISFFEDVTARQMSQLFSLFDPMRHDAMRYVEFVQMLAVLDKPDQPVVDKLQRLWELSLTFGLDRGHFDLALDVLTLCCGSLGDAAEIESAFREEFRPRCYELAILGRTAPIDDLPRQHSPFRPTTTGTTGSNSNANAAVVGGTGGVEEPESAGREHSSSSSSSAAALAASPTRLRSARISTPTAAAAVAAASASNNNNNNNNNNNIGEVNATEVPAATRKGQAVAPPYSICEAFLSQPKSFTATLKHCPRLFALFDAQLSARLVQAFGRDERRIKEEQAEMLIARGDAQKKMDFTWIMQREAPKREVFGLF